LTFLTITRNSRQASTLRATYAENLKSLEKSLGRAAKPVAPKRDFARDESTIIPRNFDILPACVSSEPFAAQTTTLRDLCSAAGIPYRYIGGTLPYIGLSRGSGNLRAVDASNHRVLVVDLAQFSATTREEEALRIIEVLAHSFHEYAARECARGLFGFPKKCATNDAPTTLTPAQRNAKPSNAPARDVRLLPGMPRHSGTAAPRDVFCLRGEAHGQPRKATRTEDHHVRSQRAGDRTMSALRCLEATVARLEAARTVAA
jgi:hypothetical protein